MLCTLLCVAFSYVTIEFFLIISNWLQICLFFVIIQVESRVSVVLNTPPLANQQEHLNWKCKDIYTKTYAAHTLTPHTHIHIHSHHVHIQQLLDVFTRKYFCIYIVRRPSITCTSSSKSTTYHHTNGNKISTLWRGRGWRGKEYVCLDILEKHSVSQVTMRENVKCIRYHIESALLFAFWPTKTKTPVDAWRWRLHM